MRLTCPICGDRDRREFYYQGDAVALDRPDGGAGAETWDGYVHLRDNPAGRTRDLWQHEAGCGAWIVVLRDTVSHEVFGVELAMSVGEAGA
ncbi:sarcosine oxidase subunit delta [Sulfitobacter sabulilitoris]|uniref:Sarcosine oxidase subunit delta n=1 Tax=Sulfitobacter sabulilitoris TaxID=2562655 RepID=A0A5S3PND2_9RHOB|nr:sarcosine oxidase subunit delta [Sulfitobacter sabulilitoris]TMM55100.1 sarcosine oxidase subunit delta [Sulfitobacter sabulilitoris]